MGKSPGEIIEKDKERLASQAYAAARVVEEKEA